MEKDKSHLPQIKLFDLSNNAFKNVESLVNDYVIQIFSETGNLPEIRHSGNYISVICEKLVETDYKQKAIKTIPFIEDVLKTKKKLLGMIDKTVKHFIPFNTPFADGTMFSKDCEITFAPGLNILESHRDENGITLITKIDLLEVSAVNSIQIKL